jgi:hypothetical protein
MTDGISHHAKLASVASTACRMELSVAAGVNPPTAVWSTKSAVKLMALGNAWRPKWGCVRDQMSNRRGAETGCRLRAQDKTS